MNQTYLKILKESIVYEKGVNLQFIKQWTTRLKELKTALKKETTEYNFIKKSVTKAQDRMTVASRSDATNLDELTNRHTVVTKRLKVSDAALKKIKREMLALRAKLTGTIGAPIAAGAGAILGAEKWKKYRRARAKKKRGKVEESKP
jgi:hypothetical protein